MSKKVVIVIFTLFLILIGVKNINAAECNYTYDGKDLKIITSDGDNIYEEPTFEANWPDATRTEYHGNTPTTETFKNMGTHNFLKGNVFSNSKQCYASIYVCNYMKSEIGQSYIYYGLFGSSLDPSTVDAPYAAEFNKDNINWGELFVLNEVHCSQVQLNEDQRNVLAAQGNLITYCERYNLLYQIIEKYYERYTNCSNNSSGNKGKAEAAKCRGEELSNAEKYTNMLKSTCSSIVQNTAINSSDGCVQSCLKATKELADLQEKYIGSTNVNGETCSLSGRLVIWISNIIKWVKYIVPVIVIVLGILDFIKAIGADKDDEMKKAQGRFVKRLIAAALVFIIPFILQFVLEKLGFAANGCGIIDL